MLDMLTILLTTAFVVLVVLRAIAADAREPWFVPLRRSHGSAAERPDDVFPGDDA